MNSIHSEFLSYGLSTVDVSLDVLIGRPYGGTAVLYRKSLANSVKIVDSNDSRITGLQVNTIKSRSITLTKCIYAYKLWRYSQFRIIHGVPW